jgi:hypothetical protein
MIGMLILEYMVTVIHCQIRRCIKSAAARCARIGVTRLRFPFLCPFGVAETSYLQNGRVTRDGW